MIKVIFIEQNEEHFNNCKSAFIQGCGNYVSSGEIGRLPNKEAVLNLQQKPEMVLRCYANEILSLIQFANSLYPETITVMPLKNQLFEDAQLFTEQMPPVIITGGSSDGTKTKNSTTYGNGLEFWDENPITNISAASYSVSYLAGKMYAIKKRLNCSWWEARYRAQISAIRSEPNRSTSLWDYKNGYGVINVDYACNFKGFIPADPYLNPFQQNAGSIRATNVNGLVSILIEYIPNATGYKIFRNGVIISNGIQLVKTDIIQRSSEPYQYTYKGYTADGKETGLSTPAIIEYPVYGSLCSLQQIRLEGNLPKSIEDGVIQPFLDTAAMEIKKLLSENLYNQIFEEPLSSSRRRECSKAEANLSLSYAVHSLNVETTGTGIIKSKGWDESKSEVLNRSETKDLSRYYRFTAMNLLSPYIPSEAELTSINIGRQSLTII